MLSMLTIRVLIIRMRMISTRMIAMDLEAPSGSAHCAQQLAPGGSGVGWGFDLHEGPYPQSLEIFSKKTR